LAEWPWRNVLITGASSGLGRALAEACAAPGVTLHLSGRDAARLDAAVAACRAKGAEVRAAVVDVTDAAATAGWIHGAGDSTWPSPMPASPAAPGTRWSPAPRPRASSSPTSPACSTPHCRRSRRWLRSPPGARDGIRAACAVSRLHRRLRRRPGRAAYCAASAPCSAGPRRLECQRAPRRHPPPRDLPRLCPHAHDGAEQVSHALPAGAGEAARREPSPASRRGRVRVPIRCRSTCRALCRRAAGRRLLNR
jgi:hypothetical protein